MSNVKCHIFLNKVVNLVVGGSVIKSLTLSRYFNKHKVFFYPNIVFRALHSQILKIYSVNLNIRSNQFLLVAQFYKSGHDPQFMTCLCERILGI